MFGDPGGDLGGVWALNGLREITSTIFMQKIKKITIEIKLLGFTASGWGGVESKLLLS